MKIVVGATKTNLGKVFDFVNKQLSSYNCSENTVSKINIGVEEIFVNIANYAYENGEGEVEIDCEILGPPLRIEISFLDSGKKFNPLTFAEPDTTVSIENRKVGGLGILLTKKLVDDLQYEYIDGRNMTKIVKELN